MMDMERPQRWCAVLEERLGHRFMDEHILSRALTHSSYAHESHTEEIKDNERLEFLGDAVLDLAVGHLLMERFKNADEGELSQARSAVVSEATLARAAQEIDLGRWLKLGKGEEQTGGRTKPSLLADAYEAMIAAVYLDGGFDAALATVRLLLESKITDAMSGESQDPKSRLQELLQKELKIRPEYRLLDEKGPEHKRRFVVAVYLQDRCLAEGEGFTKKEAEHRAAKQVLDALQEHRLKL